MADRYWEADVPELFLDLISANVVEAIRYFWEEDAPHVYIKTDPDDPGTGRIVFEVLGPEKPKAQEGCYFIEFDLLERLTDWSNPYADIGGPIHSEHKKDVLERAELLRKLADDIAELASNAVALANGS